MRKLTVRECVLLAVLVVLVLVSAYVMFFYTPMKDRLTALEQESQDLTAELEIARIRTGRMDEMERELDRVFAENPNPTGLPTFDNLKQVMFELNTILADTEDYTLSFGTVSDAEKLVRRSISLSFQTSDYSSAKEILRRLSDSRYRCMMDDLSISMEGEGVSVGAIIVYFEIVK